MGVAGGRGKGSEGGFNKEEKLHVNTYIDAHMPINSLA